MNLNWGVEKVNLSQLKLRMRPFSMHRTENGVGCSNTRKTPKFFLAESLALRRQKNLFEMQSRQIGALSRS